MRITESHVLKCPAEKCSYNCRDVCCAPSVEIGGDHPACDTFTTGSVRVRHADASVRDCRLQECHFNSLEMCTAAGVTMVVHSDHADCATFRN